MRTYEEYKRERQDEFNALPIHWAFSNRQFEEICEKLGAGPEDFYTSSALGGGFYLKSDAPVIRAYMEKPDELPELMKDYDFAYGAFLHEMGNHEYHINLQGDWDVINCFTPVDYYEAEEKGYLNLTGWEEQTKRAYLDARKEHYRLCDENGWW